MHFNRSIISIGRSADVITRILHSTIVYDKNTDQNFSVYFLGYENAVACVRGDLHPIFKPFHIMRWVGFTSGVANELNG